MIESRVLFALIDAAWQGLAVAVVAGGLLRAARTNAATRCAVWTFVLVVLAVLPVANAFAPALPHHSTVSRDANAAVRQAPRLVAVAAPVRAAVAVPSFPEPKPVRVGVRIDALRVVLALLFIAAGLRFAGLLSGYVRLRRLVAGAEPLARPLPLGTRRAIRLVASDAVDVPVAVGLGAATIVLPRTLVATLGDDELDQVLVHELAHLARRDDLTNLIERIVGAILFFHPAVHLVSRRLDLEREIACDDWVVAATGSRGRYASCLTRVAELALGASRHAAPALGLFASRGVLRKRVEHLLDASANALPRRTRFAVVAVAVLAAVAAGIGALRLPVIATPLATPKPRVSTPAQSPKIPHPLPLHAQVAHKPQPAHHPRPAPSEVPPSFVRRQLMVVRPEVSRVVAQMAQVRTDIGVNVPIRMIAVEDVAQVDATVAPAPVPMVRSSRETLRNADFRGKDLRGHNFVAYVLIDPDFTGADLRGAHFDGASLRNPKFAGARLGGATFVRSSITGCACGGVDFSGSQFVGANLHASDFSGASLARASLIGTNFMNVKVGNADFSGANLTGANFVGTDLTGANLRGANLEGINVVGAHLPR